MLEYNLTQREREIVTRLLDLSRHSKDRFANHARPSTAATNGLAAEAL